ncbi:remorin 1.4-like [Cornus florida]|uniref:remorin 1.4-like n=1 Tax=Cornus florida TaxID=4283 RepID=UPI0028A26C0E|nr:remorin 1.4-like [Cornus florida]
MDSLINNIDSLIKQVRVRFSGVEPENKEEIGTIRDQKAPSQKSQSFKGEKKKSQNWFRRQFSALMSQSDDFGDDDDFPTAVAAAAFAITSLEESSIRDQKKASEGPGTSLSKTKSKTEDKTTRIQESDKRAPISDDTNAKKPEKLAGPAPSIKRTPTLAEQRSSNAGTGPGSSAPKPDIPSTKQSAFPSTEVRRQNSTRPGIGESKADAWEKAQLDTIKERFDKLDTKIVIWENKKKTKAKQKLDKTERKLELRRAKAMKHYRSEMERVDQIAGGARTQAEKNQRDEELKVREKANKIRSIGKVPATCFYF